MTSKRAKIALLESTKVLVLFVGFYLLQSQILRVHYDIYGSTNGLRQAHARTTGELGRTREFVQQLREDTAAELAEGRRALREAVEHLEREKERILEQLDVRTQQIKSLVQVLRSEANDAVKENRSRTEANRAYIEEVLKSLAKDPELMKRNMILPTIQLRGNGTVGSGVLVYSEPQTGLHDTKVWTTFALTAYHVVSEVLGGRLDRDLEEVHVLRPDDTMATEVFSAKVVLFDRERDVALLRLNSTDRFSLLAQLMPLGDFKELDVFAPAYAVGCPLGNRPLPTLGEISSKTKRVGEQNFWMLNAPTFFGNSGGGIYESPSCRLIGVSSMIYTYGKRNPTVVPHMGLFVPIESIYRWLDTTGHSFIYRRDPIPRHLRWRLAYMPKARPVPSAARTGCRD